MQTVGKTHTACIKHIIYEKKLLMLFSQQVIDSLNRIESAQRNFNKDSTPVTH